MLLGKKTVYPKKYKPEILQAIEREKQRQELNFSEEIKGSDLWTNYEFSHLNKGGLPIRKCISVEYSSRSPFIIESKSLKLYFNSFNEEHEIIESDAIKKASRDIEGKVRSSVLIKEITTNSEFIAKKPAGFTLLEDISNLNDFKYTYDPDLLVSTKTESTLKAFTKIFKSNCLITGQPDWATIYISINGKRVVSKDSLLRYLVSFRMHNEFHEHCVERIICDLNNICDAESITVYARFTRRGGIDINPIRWIGNVDSELLNYYKQNRDLANREFEQ